MKKIIIITSFLSLFLVACSEDAMDKVNEDRNNAFKMESKNMIPDLLLKTGYETTATDLAWYSTVYIEHNAGSWSNFYQADKRIGQNNASLLNNSWNSIYDVMNISNDIIEKTDPNTGSEPDNYYTRAIAQIIQAYNLGVATDSWGEIPYKEAFKGSKNLNPSYQKQSEIYQVIFNLLDEGIKNMEKATVVYKDKDYFYGKLSDSDNIQAWIKVAYAIKARHYLRLSNVDTEAYKKALEASRKAFTSNDDSMILGGFVDTYPGVNPWGELWDSWKGLSVSSTINKLLDDRNDPRKEAYFSKIKGQYVIAPIGEADQDQSKYSVSKFTAGKEAFTKDIILFSYHELKFIEAESLFKLGEDYKPALKEAIRAAFKVAGVSGADAYYSSTVEPKLTSGNELKEILTQKYISFFDREALQAYFEYKRTRYPDMHNPNNKTFGFIERFPYALSEISSNSKNIPSKGVKDKVWWAGGTE